MRKVSNFNQKKGICTVFLMVLTAFCLTACTSTKLAEEFDEAKVKESATKAVDYLIAREYEECVAMMDANMQASLTPEALSANVDAVIEKVGAFQEYKSVAVVGQKDGQGADYAVAVVVAGFENGKLTFNVSFNVGMEMIGLWMK